MEWRLAAAWAHIEWPRFEQLETNEQERCIAAHRIHQQADSVIMHDTRPKTKPTKGKKK